MDQRPISGLTLLFAEAPAFKHATGRIAPDFKQIAIGDWLACCMTAYQNFGIGAAFELRAKRIAAENSTGERKLSGTRASLLADGIPLPGNCIFEPFPTRERLSCPDIPGPTSVSHRQNSSRATAEAKFRIEAAISALLNARKPNA